MLKKVLTIVGVTIMLCGCQTTNKSYIKQSLADKTQIFNDQAMIMNVSMSLAKEKQLWKDSHINVLHHKNSLLLVGQTLSDEHKQRSERIASNVNGIQKIYNQLTIEKPISYPQRAKDAWLTTQIKAKYFADKNLSMNDIKVLTENGRVFLMGTISQAGQESAVRIASSIDDVQEVLKIFYEPKS